MTLPDPKAFGAAGAIPVAAGIGLRSVHYRQLLERLPVVGWLEAHSENYFGAGGQPLRFLQALRENYPLSLHGVGLSPGSVDPLDREHLSKLKSLCDRFEPGLVSEHLCWNMVGGRHLNDLLPLPYTEESLAHLIARISEIQDFLGRQILIENLSSYLEYEHSTIAEWDFLVEVGRGSGCAILLDVNNIYVNASNHGFDPLLYLRAIPPALVGEIHLAGFDRYEQILIDTHGAPVHEEVWSLYRSALDLLGPVPTLIEWDNDIPELDVLLGEAYSAERILGERRALVA